MYRNVTKSWNWDYRLRVRACTRAPRHMQCTQHRQQQLFPLSVIFTLFMPYFLWLSYHFYYRFLFFPAPVSCLFPNFASRSLCICVCVVYFELTLFFFQFFILNACAYVVLVHFNSTRTIHCASFDSIYLIALKIVRPMLSSGICVNGMTEIHQIWHKF